MKKVRWGVLSTSNFAQTKVIPAMLRAQHIELVAGARNGIQPRHFDRSRGTRLFNFLVAVVVHASNAAECLATQDDITLPQRSVLDHQPGNRPAAFIAERFQTDSISGPIGVCGPFVEVREREDADAAQPIVPGHFLHRGKLPLPTVDEHDIGAIGKRLVGDGFVNGVFVVKNGIIEVTGLPELDTLRVLDRMTTIGVVVFRQRGG